MPLFTSCFGPPYIALWYIVTELASADRHLGSRDDTVFVVSTEQFHIWIAFPIRHHQWLKCNMGRKGTFPHLQIMTQSVRPPQIVTMLGKCTQPLTGGPNLNIQILTSNFAL